MGGISGGLWSHYERNAKKMYHPNTTFDWLERRIPEAIPNRVADSIKIEEDLIDAFVVPGMVPCSVEMLYHVTEVHIQLDLTLLPCS
jgi:hypothetical protein